jgi:hypothetical protein
MKTIFALILILTANAFACPDPGVEISFPGSSFDNAAGKGTQILVKKIWNSRGEAIHEIRVDNTVVTYNVAQNKWVIDGEIVEPGEIGSLKNNASGSVVGEVLVSRAGSLIFHSVNKDGVILPNAPYLVFEIARTDELNHGETTPGTVGHFGPADNVTESLTVSARSNYKDVGAYFSSADTKSQPKSIESTQGLKPKLVDVSSGGYKGVACGDIQKLQATAARGATPAHGRP